MRQNKRAFIKVFMTLIVSMVCVSCASLKNVSHNSFKNKLVDKDYIAVPVQFLGSGLITVPVTIGNANPVPFIIDTGATRSAIYKSSAIELGLPIESENQVQIYGMVSNALRPEIRIPELRVGGHLTVNAPFAVLERPKYNSVANEIVPAGILAMDVLEAYRLYFDYETKQLYFSVSQIGPPLIAPEWRKITLTKNPHIADGRNLRFMNLRMIGPSVPALLDTGSELNIMNWRVAKYPTVRQMRKRLRDSWILAGAVGEFNPRIRTRVDRFRAGQKFWQNKEFLVMDFDNLDILGIAEKPFIIAGVNLLTETSFILDFKHNVLALEPKKSDYETGFEVKRQSGIRAGTSGPIASRVRKK